jgi:aspartate carbamoyltransferase catalytic subunit
METNLIKKLEKIRGAFELKSTDIISIDDLSKKEIEMIMTLSEEMESFLKGDMKKIAALKGKSQLNFFMENSTRTRASFELAGKNLGADTINIAASASSMKKGETLLDTAITLDQLQPDIIVMRTGSSGAVKFFAKNVEAAVINAGDGWNEHPSQGLLDLYTMRKFVGKSLKGKKLVIVGDIMHSRVFGSLARITQKYGIEVVVTAPHTLIRPNLQEAWGIAHEPSIEKALVGADMVYVLRLQTERAAAAFVPTLREYSKTYVINAKRMKLAKPNAIVMHAGPVIRELDIHTNVLETNTAVIKNQVFSGYCVRFILLWLLANKRKEKTVKERLYKAE